MSENLFPLVMEGVSFHHNGQTIVDNMTLCLDGATRTIILGANGAGKSVTMRVLHGLIAPTSGRITWGGQVARPLSASNKQAMVFQKPVMLRTSALRNVTYALKLAGVPNLERLARARQAMVRVGLGHLESRAARVLSGGEQQRLALARAWALNPRVLFLDEPTASLDPTATREIEEIIAEIAAAGTKIVMTTHSLGQAQRLADEIVFLHRGRVVEQTPATEFFQKPRSPEAAAFIKGELPWI